MNSAHRIAIVTRGDTDTRRDPQAALGRFADLVDGLVALGHPVASVIYDESWIDDVRDQLLDADVVLVWVNPVDDGRDRSQLDELLREVAAVGITVSCHPDIVLKLGTKDVLYETRGFGWGTDTRRYHTPEDLHDGLAESLSTGARVLKQHRGSSGSGVWSAELVDSDQRPTDATPVRVRHAKRGSADEVMPFGDFCQRLSGYLESGPLIDQEFQHRIDEGTVRCYLVRDQVGGFGLQETNALIPTAAGAAPPVPTSRTYHPATLPEFQNLKQQLERAWVPALKDLFDLSTGDLPLLWDCGFLIGSPDADGLDTYVLCEINVSSVSPYPGSAVPSLIESIGELPVRPRQR